jgi:hypothetical protein
MWQRLPLGCISCFILLNFLVNNFFLHFFVAVDSLDYASWQVFNVDEMMMVSSLIGPFRVCESCYFLIDHFS